jgi:hypothetical protein
VRTAAALAYDRHDPAPPRGLGIENFRRIGRGGLGDGHNNYAHSMAWFKGKLYLGTTRSNLCMLRLQSAFEGLALSVWPVECPDSLDGLYRLDRRAQIWSYDPIADEWEMVFRAPVVDSVAGPGKVPREIGYRSMEVYQSPSDPEPALYIAAWAPGRAPGGLIIRTYDGRNFDPVTPYGILETRVATTRSLVALGGRMFFAPTGQRGTDGGQQNVAGVPIVFECREPAREKWIPVSEPAFGDPGNLGIFTLSTMGDRLYAGTFNLAGLQVWACTCRGTPPYKWRKLIDAGGGRGALNQAVASMVAFKDAIYLGTGIQGGGIDRVNHIGPAAGELIRINADDSWELIAGDARMLPHGNMEPLSGFRSGFGNFFNGYIWALGVHEGWLYAGTYDWSMTMRWALLDENFKKVHRLFEILDPEVVVANEGGADLWRSHDGENWLPVTRRGFGNGYNIGIRNLVSSPIGLFVGTGNLFGPRVAVRAGEGWRYEDNPDGGLEVWLGCHGA